MLIVSQNNKQALQNCCNHFTPLYFAASLHSTSNSSMSLVRKQVSFRVQMCKRIGASESSSESGRVGRHVRCGELKKGLFGPGGGYKKRQAKRADSAKRTPGGRQATKGSAFDEVKLKQGPGYDKREVKNLPLVRTLSQGRTSSILVQLFSGGRRPA